MSHLLPSNLTHHRGPLRPFALGLHALDTLAGWGIIVMLGVMVVVVSVQVLLRYALNSSLGFADELSRLTFVWSIFLGIPLGIRRGSHIGIEFLTARLPAVLHYDGTPITARFIVDAISKLQSPHPMSQAAE